MNFSPDINLTHRAAVAVVSSLWNQSDVVTQIHDVLFQKPGYKQWSEIDVDVLASVRKLKLPVQLKFNLENFVQPLGKQICKWVSLTACTFQAYPHLSKPLEFIFTERGILDYSKTTRLIIEHNSDKILCFCLACIFSIEDIILKLWPEVKHILLVKVESSPFDSSKFIFLRFWVYYLNDELEKLMNLTECDDVTNAFQLAFELTSEQQCLSSTKYFLQKIEPETRQELIKGELAHFFLCKPIFTFEGDLFLYFLSNLKESDVDKMKFQQPCELLYALLEWPCQEIFIKTALSVFEYLPKEKYLHLIFDLLEYKSKFYVGNIYNRLLVQFWKITPPSFKEYVFNKCISGSFLSNLIKLRGADEILQLILNDCSSSQRLQMLYFKVMKFCDYLMKKNRWQTLKLLITNCIHSEDDLVQFIEQYRIYKPYDYNDKMKLRIDILIEKIKEWY